MAASTEAVESNKLRWVLKLVVLGFVSAAIADLLETHAAIPKRMPELIGLVSGVVIQQAIPPRLSLGRLFLVLLGVGLLMGSLVLFHL